MTDNHNDRKDLNIFDREDALTRFMGDEQLLETLLDGYIVEIESQIGSLYDALKEENAKSSAIALHTIKGCAANMSAEELRVTSKRLEGKVKENKFSEVMDSFEELEDTFTRLKQVIRQHS
ncbi:Hpt domain-containing protein [Balneolaceae bacterium ANBcel3]|nr:Hpt domain-containing protein [Balneolaceae bacterium ANBcel3]